MISILILFKHAALAPSFRCSQYEQQTDEFREGLLKEDNARWEKSGLIIDSHSGFLGIEMLMDLKDKFL